MGQFREKVPHRSCGVDISNVIGGQAEQDAVLAVQVQACTYCVGQPSNTKPLLEMSNAQGRLDMGE